MKVTDKTCMSPSPLKTLNKDFRNFYRKQTKDIMHKRLHHYDNDRIMSLFFKKMSEDLVEYRAGIHIKKLGYFFIYKHPFKFPPSAYLNHMKPYYPTFIPTENSVVKYWSMDFKFNRVLVAKIDTYIRKGYRYLNMINGVSKKDYMYLGAAMNSIRYKKIKENEL